jgi:uncharacterized protein DUF222
MATTGADEQTPSLGERLALMPPGAELGVMLAGLDPTLVDDADVLEIIAAWDRQTSHSNAMQLAAMAEFARRPWSVDDDTDAARDRRGAPGIVTREFADDEIAARLGISPLSAGYRLRLGLALMSPLSATAGALKAGTIDVAKARTLADGCQHLDPATAVEVESAVLNKAPQLSNGRLKAALRKALITVDPIAAQQRCRIAKNERGVWITPLDDGVAELRALLSAPDAVVVYNVLTATAVAAKAAGDETRVMAQLRADFLVAPFKAALAAGELAGLKPAKLGTHRGRGAELNVMVPASVMMGVSNAPGELVGYGPITGEVCRELRADSTMRRLVTNPVTGTFLAADVGTYQDTYRPNAALVRHVEFRDQSCVFLGCSRPAARCHIDHSCRFPDGRTCDDNLGPLCPRHHIFKHALDDALAKLKHRTLQQPKAGTFIWTMPTGHTYTRTPPAIAPPIKDEVVGSKEPPPDLSLPLEELEFDPTPFEPQSPDPLPSEPSGSDPPPF